MPLLLVYEALGMKSPHSLAILILEVLIEILIKQFWKSCAPEGLVFADRMNLLGIEDATLPCCRIKNHAARTRQWY
jgi:hypothetical protein